MGTSHRAAFHIALLGLGVGACRSGVAGSYELDVEMTKACVAKAAVDDPDDAAMKKGTIELLSSTRVQLRLEPSGKMTSTISLTGEGAPTPQAREGTWQLEGKRVLLRVKGTADTRCDIEGPRLRCQKPTSGALFSSYVLVRS